MFFKRNIHLTKTIYDQFRWCGKPPGHHFEKNAMIRETPRGTPGIITEKFPRPPGLSLFLFKKKVMSPPFPDRVLVYH